MQETTSDIITLSSDDESDMHLTKKIKLLSESPPHTQPVVEMLNTLREMSAFPQEKSVEEETKDKQCSEKNSLTIIIERSATSRVKREKSFTSNSSVVIIDEDPLEESSVKLDENLKNGTTIILDDPSEESEDLADVTLANSSISENGFMEEKKCEHIQIDERPSTSTASEAHILLEQFLEACSNSIKGSKYETRLLTKFTKMKKHFNNCERLHNEISLKRMLQDYIKMAQCSAPDAVVCFQRVFSYFLDNIKGPTIEISEENLHKIRKLEKTCKALLKKLKQLEESEVNFDDENDSTYLQIERYSKRLDEVYKKYCQIINRNHYAGRLLYERIHFVSSNHHEINRAITKTYKHNKFPTYYDIEKCIRKCVSKNSLPLSEEEIKVESKNCFTKLGNLLQLRRKKELYEDHCGFITLNEDPANTDQELNTKLQNSLNEGAKKMNEVISKFVRFQEENINPDLSEDSEDSNYQSSDSES